MLTRDTWARGSIHQRDHANPVKEYGPDDGLRYAIRLAIQKNVRAQERPMDRADNCYSDKSENSSPKVQPGLGHILVLPVQHKLGHDQHTEEQRRQQHKERCLCSEEKEEVDAC
ncbi:hypothetical protein BGZ96_007044 [Linnemannia gamsii]|uniref:Uncharacterized protein n=1 Tax=Linnemannia gamsii TaxID=64522 RepID=A0ABQ7KES7_9FUNG|nr:hypothetical protein BGZ96_007044 [Linnemannia gamsii]